MKRARRASKISGQTEHVYGECRYATRKTWLGERRGIYKAEVVRVANKEAKDNPRFVVTNLKQSPQWIYEKTYCQRGDVENRIKELHDGMQIGRTSCSNFLANTFRVLLTAAAYVLMQEMRLHLSPTRHARAQVSTLREHFLKLGAQVIVTVRRIFVPFSKKLFGVPLSRIMQVRDRMNMSVSADSERFGSGCESVCRLSRNARGPVALRLGLCQPAEFSSPAVQPLVCALDIGC